MSKYIFMISVSIISVGITIFIIMLLMKLWKRNNTDLGDLKQISAIPPFLKSSVDKETYYFDENYLYSKGTQDKRYLLNDIIEVRKTSLRINKKPTVEMVINNGEEIVINFWPNVSIFNKNFNEFIEKMKQKNKSVVKFEKYSLLY